MDRLETFPEQMMGFFMLGFPLGRKHRRIIDTGQTQEVFKALNATISGFEDEIKRLDRLGMRFAIFRNG